MVAAYGMSTVVFAYATLDVYTEQQPTTLPEVNLLLTNSRGEVFSTSLILGWRLFLWDNHQMTFPLDGNDYNHPPVPPHILSDVAARDPGIAGPSVARML